jgi:lysophospholipase L1-like esterase
VWVNNAGIDGHSTFGHLELIDQCLAALHPKLLLFYVGLNDVDRKDLSAYDSSLLREKARGDDTPARSLQRFLLRHSDAFALFDNLRLQWSARQKGLMHGEPMGHRQPTKDGASIPLTPSAREEWLQARDPVCLTGYESRLRLLIERCRELQIECVLATQPVLYGIGADEVTGIDLEAIRVGEVDGAAQWELLQRYNQITVKVGDEFKVPVIDVANMLPKSSRYFYDLTHYNTEGAEEVASIMYEGLSRHFANTEQASLGTD